LLSILQTGVLSCISFAICNAKHTVSEKDTQVPEKEKKKEHKHEQDHGGSCGHDQHEHHSHNENLYGVFLHIAADALGSIGVIISSLLIMYFEWYISDAICSAVTSIMIFLSIIPLLKSSSFVLMQTYPSKYEQKIAQAITDISNYQNVISVKDIHIWTYTHDHIVVSMCIITKAKCENTQEIKNFAHEMMSQIKYVKDTTIQIEFEDDIRQET